MNETIAKFGYPATLIAEYAHWVVLLRPAQLTVGSLVLAAKSSAGAFGSLPAAFHAELAQVTTDIERALKAAIDYERLNYLMLMMVDPHVHFHVIPRYQGMRNFGTLSIQDKGWPGPPDLASATALDPAQRVSIAEALRTRWDRVRATA